MRLTKKPATQFTRRKYRMSEKRHIVSYRKILPIRHKRIDSSSRTSDMQISHARASLTGKQKAAMLLMNLDSATAAELLDGVDTKVAKELAVELAHLDATGFDKDGRSLKFAKQFCNSLQIDKEFHVKGFLKEVLKSTVGDEKTEQIQGSIQDVLCEPGPFEPICSAESRVIASVLENEHPQTTALVLSKLPVDKSSEVLDLLDGSVRISAINRMDNCESISEETKMRISEMVCKRLDSIVAGSSNGTISKQSEQSPKKLAVILRNLGREIRDGLLGAMRCKDKKKSDMVADLMVSWEEIPQITDGSLKKVLRRVDVKKLALALVGADDELVQKIHSNITEPMNAMLEEHAMLMSTCSQEEVEEARNEIVQILREINKSGELAFTEQYLNVEQDCN